MHVPNSLQCYSFVPPPALSFLHSFTENTLNHVSFYTAYALRNKSELIMRGPSLRKYTRQLWSRMACNSSPDPIPNLLIRCFFSLRSPSFALTFQQNSLKWELAVPLKIHLKPNMSSISFCWRGDMWGWNRCLLQAELQKFYVFLFLSVPDNLWDLWSQLLNWVCVGQSCVTNESGRHSR